MKSARKPYTQTPKNRPKNINALEKDALQVFCRLRPTNQEVCMRVLSNSVVCVYPPDNGNNYRGVSKESQFMFKQVFIPDTTQQQVFETVSQPLVEGLIQGKNGLLFTYGVTGSGKTYTMTGDSKSAGIMPRCIQTLFKTISDYQAEKYVFKPDRLNGFEMQTDMDAQSDRSDDARSKRRAAATPLAKSSSESSLASLSGSEIYSLKGVDTANIYSVFITFVEIYNNGVFDLLDENQKSLQNKIIREDYMHNMFVHGVTEVEVKSPSEAMTLFCRGQKRKRMAYTDLNAESSRSHSIFTIRLVQTAANSDVENQQITISQLSLVDLAGSERSSRTKNTGARLKEASNINNSLLNLRICLEILRENYVTGGTRLVPYRDNKLTHLFKMYFEGGGYVRMIVCVNPSSLDYEESLQVMKFAELSQDVQIAKPTPMRVDVEITPRVKHIDVETPKNNRYILPPTSATRSASVITDRRRGRQIMPPPSKPDLIESDKNEIDYGLVYNLNDLPRVKITSFGDYELLKQLRHALEQRMTKRNKCLEDLRARQSHFRKLCNEYDVYKLSSAAEIDSLKVAGNQYLERIETLENRLVDTEKERDELHTAIEHKNEQIYAQQIELNEKDLIVSQTLMEKEKQKKKFDTKFINHQEKLHQDFEQKLREQRENLRQRMKDKDIKIRQVRKIVLGDDANSTTSSELDLLALKGTPNNKNRVLTELDLNMVNSPTATNSNQQQQYTSKMCSSNTPIRRRSRSVGPCERWLEHRVGLATDLGTLLQPQMKKTKTLTKLTTPNDLMKKSVSKYCLISQEPDTDGEIETRVVKGDVIQTTGGGAQVIFNDVEVLRQDSPTRTRKRSMPPNSSELTARCSIGIEGHNTSKRSKS